MNLKSLIEKMDEISAITEAKKSTATGTVHTAEPGGYGRKFDTDEEDDEKKAEKPAVKRGRGRPKKNADSDTGEVKKWDTAELGKYIIGNKPEKLPGKTSVKHKISDVEEAVETTPKGKVHKAEPGGYGRKFDTDEEGDEKKAAKPAVKRGRGRPKKGADSDTGEVKKWDTADLGKYIIGNKPDKLPGKTGVKHKLKDWIEHVEAKLLAEMAVPPGMKPMAILDPANKEAGVGVLKATDPKIQQLLGALNPKDVQIVMTKSAMPSGGQSTQKSAGAKPGAPVAPTASTTPVTEEEVMEKAPPGMEDVVMALKKKFPGEEGRAYAIAWSQYNKKHGKTDESLEEIDELARLREFLDVTANISGARSQGGTGGSGGKTQGTAGVSDISSAGTGGFGSGGSSGATGGSATGGAASNTSNLSNRDSMRENSDSTSSSSSNASVGNTSGTANISGISNTALGGRGGSSNSIAYGGDASNINRNAATSRAAATTGQGSPVTMEEGLSKILAAHPHEHKMCQEGWGMDESLYEALCDHYFREGHIPRKIWHGSLEELRDWVEECYLRDTGALMDEGAAGTALGIAAGKILAPEIPGAGIVGAYVGDKLQDKLQDELMGEESDILPEDDLEEDLQQSIDEMEMHMNEEKKWIQKAIKKPGAMKAAAEREGLSTSEYIKKHEHEGGKAGQRARLAKTLKGMHTEEIAEGLDPEKRARLDDLIDQFRDATDPNDYYDRDYSDPEEVIELIRSEFGDKIADQVDAGADKMHFGHHDNFQRSDPLAWKTYRGKNRVTKGGKLFKQDSDYLKNTIKARYNNSGKSATEDVAEDVDTGEYDARKSTPSSKEAQDAVHAKHRERMKHLRKEMDHEDKKKEVEEGVVDTLKSVGKKVLDVVAPDDEKLLKQLQQRAGIPAHAQHGKPNMAKSDEQGVTEGSGQEENLLNYEPMEDHKGSFWVKDPQTGKILGQILRPRFPDDPDYDMRVWRGYVADLDGKFRSGRTDYSGSSLDEVKYYFELRYKRSLDKQGVAEGSEEVEESGLQAYLGNKKYGEKGMDALRKAGREGASKEKMAKIRAKYDKLDEQGVAEGYGNKVTNYKNGVKLQRSSATNNIRLSHPEHAPLVLRYNKHNRYVHPTQGEIIWMTLNDIVNAYGKNGPEFRVYGIPGSRKQDMTEGTRDDAMAGLQRTVDFAKQHGYKIYRSPSGKSMRFVNKELDHEIRARVDNDGDSININFIDHRSGISGNDDASYFDETFKDAYEQALQDYQQSQEPYYASRRTGAGMKADKENAKWIKDIAASSQKDVQMESWDKELSNLLNEGLTVTTSTGQPGGSDSISISATDEDAQSLMKMLQHSGIMRGQSAGSSAMPQDDGGASITVEPVSADEVMSTLEPAEDDGEESMSFLKKMLGARQGVVKSASSEEVCDDCGHVDCQCDHEEVGEDNYESTQHSSSDHAMSPVPESEVEEGNLFTGNLEKARAAGKKEADLDGDGDMEKVKGVDEDFTGGAIGGIAGAVLGAGAAPGYMIGSKVSDDFAKEEALDQPATMEGEWDGTGTADLAGAVAQNGDGREDAETEKETAMSEGEERCDECGMYESKCGCDHDEDKADKLDEWANTPSGNAEDKMLADMVFMTKSISGGLNNMKQDQTVVPSARVKTEAERHVGDLSMAEMLRKLQNIN